jgi:thiol-disulfide isomerase/thioredoxin
MLALVASFLLAASDLPSPGDAGAAGQERRGSVLGADQPPLLEELPPGAPTAASPAPRPPVIRRVTVDPRRLEPELRALAQEASRSRARVLVELGAPWCEPCRALEAAFSRESNRAVLARWWLVEVNVDLLPPGAVLGRSTHTVPALVRLDGSGHPEGWLQGAALPADSSTRLDAALREFLTP